MTNEEESTLKDRSNRIDVPDDAVIEALRDKTPAERFAMVAAAQRTARMLVAAGTRSLHPDWTDAEVAAHTLRRMSGGTA